VIEDLRPGRRGRWKLTQAFGYGFVLKGFSEPLEASDWPENLLAGLRENLHMQRAI
jgi:hypothetical protein